MSCKEIVTDEPTHSRRHFLAATQTNLSSATHHWYEGPRKLGYGRLETILCCTWDILLTLAPVYFFALAILAHRLEGARVSEYGQRIVDLTQLAPTIYPILFAAIAGRCFKNIARWAMERHRGISLGTLEQTFGSQSLASAVERLIFVRSHVPFGILVVLIWGLSPLGGQSAVRLLYTAEATESRAGTAYYANPHLQFSVFETGRDTAMFSNDINNMYLASLLASQTQRGSPVDLWGLPKIPQWPRGLGDDVSRQISQDEYGLLASEQESYVSLLGVPIFGLNFGPVQAQYTFTVEHPYFEVDCNSIRPRLSKNQTASYFPEKIPGAAIATFAVDIAVPNISATFPNVLSEPIPIEQVPPAQLLYATRYDIDGWRLSSLFNCSVRVVVVETDIECTASSGLTTCHATHQKLKKGFDTNDFFNSLITSVGSITPRANLLAEWPIAERLSSYYKMSLTDTYLAGPGHRFSPGSWANVPLKDFSRRLTTVLNTYWEASLDPQNHTDVAFQRQPTTGEISEDTIWLSPFLNQTESTSTESFVVYRADRRWVVILLVTTSCLEILAVVGLLLELFIRGPDILGYASSLTRDNYVFGLPPDGSAMDGAERARALRHLRVRLADLQPEMDVGYVAFEIASSTDPSGVEQAKSQGPLSRDKLYS
ncbi:hypothetical protein B0I35DRAFT_358262 [Stachybotrys elegans]|uniref:Uncharacterized protein n=1 Tax=Stachybotrys elegans TaxID=80388 RepID=A0A8K0SI73_9HYPO|nr:hypothetical protein B0I35DRAFT_358262 [Stachybotrys elegans]